MIHDRLENAAAWFAFDRNLADGLKWLRSTALESLPLGKVVIDGERLFAMVQEYDTKPLDKTTFEAHRRYGDIQYVVSGVEAIDVLNVDRLTVTHPYDAALEVALFASPPQATRLSLTAGDFAVFYPRDGHRPQIAFGDPTPVRKIVVKFEVV